MSEQDNVRVVQQLYQAMAAGDIPTLMGLVTDDAVLVSPGPADLVPWAGEYHGTDELLKYLTVFGQGVETSGMEVHDLIAQGDKVVVLGRHAGLVRATGRSYELQWAQVCTLREGKIAAITGYHDTYLVAEAARPG